VVFIGSYQMKNYVFIILLIIFIVECKKERLTVIVSMDGFRHDYMKMYGGNNRFPTLQRLIKTGVSSSMIPVFPSETVNFNLKQSFHHIIQLQQVYMQKVMD
jgi:predicted AlkP superfamily pyrophosphatase or phosphodiesterase